MSGSFARRYWRRKRITSAGFFHMTSDDRNDEQPASLSLAQVYRLIALEQIEMERRVAEKRGGDVSNVVYLTARAAKGREIKTERSPRRRTAG
jgi:hypothetical protein